jgi:hypothetical protein
MRVKPANLGIKKGFVQTTRGAIVPIYVATYHGVALGEWVSVGGDQYFFSLPDGRNLYGDTDGKTLIFRIPKRRLEKRIALVRLINLRKATLKLLEIGLLP